VPDELKLKINDFLD
jgi:hypothetical protein